MRQHQQNPKIRERYGGLTNEAGAFNGTVRFNSDALLKLRARKPTAFAVWTDLFYEGIDSLVIGGTFSEFSDARQHRILVLTKRPERMARWSQWYNRRWPDNVWAGVTVCNQEEADEKIPLLLQVPAAVRFLSIEPMLGPIDLKFYAHDDGVLPTDAEPFCERQDRVHWVIGGGESGPGARPMHQDWARSIRDQCAAAGVPFLFKQWGEFAPCDHFPGLRKPGPVIGIDGQPDGQMARVGRKAAGRLLDGREHSAIPKTEAPHA
jgi:protein gp37